MSSSVAKEIRKIRVDSTYEKKKHFNAAERKEQYHYLIGIPVVVINVLLGSFMMGVLSEASPDWAKWATAGAALLAACLSGVSTFLNLRKDVEGHRRVGNRYLEISRECDIALSKYEDDITDSEELAEQLDHIKDRRSQINTDAENYSTSSSDYQKAKEGIKEGEEEYKQDELKRLQS